MKIAIYSDLHVEFGVFYPPADLDADVVILAGDILCPGDRVARWARRANVFGNRPLIHVAGNHEYYSTEYQTQLRRMREEAERFGIHFLQQDSLTLNGVRFLGTTLWTDFELFALAPDGESDGDGATWSRTLAMQEAGQRLSDFRTIQWADGTSRRNFAPDDMRQLHLAEREWLRQELLKPFDGPTVVITHHAPHRGSLDADYAVDPLSAAFVSQLPDEFFEAPTLWVHGHTHQCLDYRVAQCRVVCNPRGYTFKHRPQAMGRYEVEAFNQTGMGVVL